MRLGPTTVCFGVIFFSFETEGSQLKTKWNWTKRIGFEIEEMVLIDLLRIAWHNSVTWYHPAGCFDRSCIILRFRQRNNVRKAILKCSEERWYRVKSKSLRYMILKLISIVVKENTKLKMLSLPDQNHKWFYNTWLECENVLS